MDGKELRLFNERTVEAQRLRIENQWLRSDRDGYRVDLFEADQRLSDLEDENARLAEENRTLKLRVAELTSALKTPADVAAASPELPSFVKANVPAKARKEPGRKAGHAAALRPPPAKIDVRQDAPLPADSAGRPGCPHCKCSLSDVKKHERIVEDLVPSRVVVTCYKTKSGWCAQCRKRVESRAREQPPAANLPHGQLGVNALATAATLRIVHRLPLRQVSRVLSDLPGLSVSPGGVTRQPQRVGKWLAPRYERINLELRTSPRVHADETGWRTDGKNGYLWAVTDPEHTLYHVDPSRSGTVIEKLLGETFDGKLVADFYAAYDRMACTKQRCLVHLLRELKETAEKHPAFAAGPFYVKAKKLVKDLLKLKGQWDELSDQAYTSRAVRLETKLDHLSDDPYDEPQANRLARRLRRYKKELTEFLWDKNLDGTNNAAERALRPAVAARKISGGSRSEAGALAWARLASLMRTADQQGKNVVDVIRKLLMECWAGEPMMALLVGGDKAGR